MSNTSLATTMRSPAGSFGTVAAVCLGAAALTVACCVMAAANARVAGAAALLIIVGFIWLPFVVETHEFMSNALLLLLAATMSLSIKKHLMAEPGHLGGAIGYKLAITDLLVLALMAAFLLTTGRRRSLHVVVPKSILISFCCYFVIATVSTATGISPKLGAFQCLAYLQSFLLFVFLLNFLTSLHRLRIFVAGLVAGVVIQSGFAILQARQPGEYRYAFLGAQEEEQHRVVRGRLDLPSVDLGTTTIAGSLQERPMGLLIHPNVLALYLALSIPLAASTWFLGAGLGRRVANTGVVAVAVAAMYYTLSRSGWLALALALLVMGRLAMRWKPLQLSRWEKAIILALVLSIGIALAWSAKTIYLRMTETADEAMYFRKTLNTAALKMAAAHPFFGVGLNGFVSVVQQFDSSTMSRVKAYPAHNIVLLETGETGFLGGLAFMAVWLSIFGSLYVLVRVRGAAEPRLLLIASLAGLAGFFIGDMSNFAYRIPVVTNLVWAQAAVGLAAGRLNLKAAEGADHV